ncbi:MULTISPECIES: hypothetical protein [Streptomyces]|uniref:Uncharacterized protein n=1 Tax=Streptomyces lonegramiae TaxID=3075524 RepID=A0ABU2X9T3_9ACTN|nr:hypothetical protein [Streptomyces sp. DSM 41529]MDT0542674.1 hypothetical protein [Streptomyces sp. DSM 41529]
MDEMNQTTIPLRAAQQACAQLARQGWEAARLALEELERRGAGSVRASRAGAATMAGVYALRSELMSASPGRTVELARFADELARYGEDTVRFFSVERAGWTVLCVVSDDLARGVAATAVRGGERPGRSDAGAAAEGELPATAAGGFCEELLADGWSSAELGVQGLAERPSATVPLWLGSAAALADGYRARAEEYARMSSPRRTRDLERFVAALAEHGEDFVRFFSVERGDWTVLCVVAGDLSRALAANAISRASTG